MASNFILSQLAVRCALTLFKSESRNRLILSGSWVMQLYVVASFTLISVYSLFEITMNGYSHIFSTVRKQSTPGNLYFGSNKKLVGIG